MTPQDILNHLSERDGLGSPDATITVLTDVIPGLDNGCQRKQESFPPPDLHLQFTVIAC